LAAVIYLSIQSTKETHMQKLLTVRIDGALLQKLRVATVQRDTTIAAVVREGLEAWLAKNPAKAGAAAKPAKKAAKPAKKAKK
jgi:hypothetical protein